MAQYQWTGAGETAGNAPTLFTNIWGGSIADWQVQADATADTEGKVLAFINTSSSSDRRTLTLDAAGTAVSGRISARGRFWVDGGKSPHFVRTYVSGSEGSETGFYAGTNSADDLAFSTYTSGNFSFFGDGGGPLVSGWNRFKLLLDPTGTVKTQLWVWGDADAEPAAPTLSETSLPLGGPPGALGYGNFASAATELDWISFGTDGDDAEDLKDGGGPAVLSTPTASTDETGGYTGSVSTDTGTDTLYHVVTLTAATPAAAQVIAGQNNAGTAAVKSASQAVTATGSQSVSGSDLSADTVYYMHFVQSDGTESSSVVTSAQFSYNTPVEPLATPTNLTSTEITASSALLSWTRGV